MFLIRLIISSMLLTILAESAFNAAAVPLDELGGCCSIDGNKLLPDRGDSAVCLG